MIAKALQITNDALNQYLRHQIDVTEPMALVNSLVNVDGSVPAKNQNKLILTLVNFVGTDSPNVIDAFKAGSVGVGKAPKTHQIHVLLSSNFDDYTEGLKILSLAMNFLEANPVFERKNYPALPQDITRLTLSPEPLAYPQIQSIWLAMGAKYRPSVVYKLELISQPATNIDDAKPATTSTPSAEVVS